MIIGYEVGGCYVVLGKTSSERILELGYWVASSLLLVLLIERLTRWMMSSSRAAVRDKLGDVYEIWIASVVLR